MLIRSTIINDCVNNLNEFGYSGVDSKNIFPDTLYSAFFKKILESNLGQDSFIDCAIEDLLREPNE